MYICTPLPARQQPDVSVSLIETAAGPVKHPLLECWVDGELVGLLDFVQVVEERNQFLHESSGGDD